MLTDDQLEKLSFDVDGELNRLCHDYEVDPLSMAAVVLARSMRFMRDMGGEEDFRKLIIHSLGLKDDGTRGNRTLQ